MSLCVLNPGPLTTVQDLGREGCAAEGFRRCGAADDYAAWLANLLIGNNPGDAVLETTLRGPEVQFVTGAVFALAGAEADATLAGRPVPFFTPCLCPGGQPAHHRHRTRRTAQLPGGVGWHRGGPRCGAAAPPTWPVIWAGFSGRALHPGDVLPLARTGQEAAAHWQELCRRHLDRPLGDRVVCRGPAPWRQLGTERLPLLRAVPGPQAAAFTPGARDLFVHSVYRLTPDCNRMACKLQGPALETVSGGGYSVGRHCGGLGAGVGQRPAHRHAGRPPDHTGGLCQDRHRHLRRPARVGPAAAGAGGGL